MDINFIIGLFIGLLIFSILVGLTYYISIYRYNKVIENKEIIGKCKVDNLENVSRKKYFIILYMLLLCVLYLFVLNIQMIMLVTIIVILYIFNFLYILLKNPYETYFITSKGLMNNNSLFNISKYIFWQNYKGYIINNKHIILKHKYGDFFNTYIINTENIEKIISKYLNKLYVVRN